jgi:transmembrane sensor
MKPKHNIEETDYSFLESYQSIEPQKDWELVRKRAGFNSKKTLTRIWWSAASIILLLGVGFLAQRSGFNNPDLITIYAQESLSEVRLPDGSLITLNKDASIVYPEKFQTRKRIVEIAGEAFFEVESDPDHPFIVHVGSEAIVEVLGTKFNVNSDEDLQSIGVQVVEGRVAFSSPDRKFFQITLGKNEQASLANGKISKEETIDRNFLSWKTGILHFDQSSLKEVSRQLESHYGRKVELDPGLSDDLIFTSTIDSQNFESVIEEITLVLGLEAKYEEERVILSVEK